MKTFKTPKSTELPLLNLRGKDYLQVAHRLVWFREERPNWSIETEFISIKDNSAICKAVILDEQRRIIATAHKCEDTDGFKDFLEKSETGAIGRALALCGYGTQFAPEIEEGERLADAPLAAKHEVKNVTQSSAVAKPALAAAKPKYCAPKCEKMLVSNFNPDELYCPKCRRKQPRDAA